MDADRHEVPTGVFSAAIALPSARGITDRNIEGFSGHRVFMNVGAYLWVWVVCHLIPSSEPCPAAGGAICVLVVLGGAVIDDAKFAFVTEQPRLVGFIGDRVKAGWVRHVRCAVRANPRAFPALPIVQIKAANLDPSAGAGISWSSALFSPSCARAARSS